MSDLQLHLACTADATAAIVFIYKVSSYTDDRLSELTDQPVQKKRALQTEGKAMRMSDLQLHLACVVLMIMLLL